MTKIDVDKKTFPNNVDIVIGFENYLKLKKLKPQTIESKLWTVKKLLDYLKHKSAAKISRQDIQNFVLEEAKTLKPSSQNTHIFHLQQFIQYLKTENILTKQNQKEDYFQNIELNKIEREDTSNIQYITRDDILMIIRLCKCQRDRALFFLLFDSGARIGEILNLNVSDIHFNGKYVTVSLDGKTGKRTVPISASVPDLQIWLNQYQGKPDDPLFPTRNGRMALRTAENIFDALTKKAGIEAVGKKCNLHSTRHGRISELADQGMPETHLRKFSGWTSTSDMPSRYIHIPQKEVEKRVLKLAGYTDDELEAERKPVTALKPVKCRNPLCGFENPCDAIRCVKCSTIVDEKAALEELEEEKRLKAADQHELMRHVDHLVDERVKAMFASLLAKSDKKVVEEAEKELGSDNVWDC